MTACWGNLDLDLSGVVLRFGDHRGHAGLRELITAVAGQYALAGKEQITLGGSVVDEGIAFQVLRQRERLPAEVRARAAIGLDIVKRWIESEPLLEWVQPTVGVICCLRIVAGTGIDPDRFHQKPNDQCGTFAGAGRWFEQDSRSTRIGFGYPPPSQLEIGLENVSRALRDERI